MISMNATDAARLNVRSVRLQSRQAAVVGSAGVAVLVRALGGFSRCQPDIHLDRRFPHEPG
jgi:hypothetical protein